ASSMSGKACRISSGLRRPCSLPRTTRDSAAATITSNAPSRAATPPRPTLNCAMPPPDRRPAEAGDAPDVTQCDRAEGSAPFSEGHEMGRNASGERRMRQDEQPDDGEMQAGGGDDEAMEDLMESEDPRPWVRPLDCVDDGTDAVKGTPADEQPERRPAQAVDDLRGGDETEPAEGEVGDHLCRRGGMTPQQGHPDARRSTAPNRQEKREGHPAAHGEQADRREGARDQEKDHRAVHA